jgi:hypothetical protein
MNNTETSLAKVSLFNVVNKRHCPQFGNQMREADRCKKGSIIDVWFECVKTECDGQWFQSYAGLAVSTC